MKKYRPFQIRKITKKISNIVVIKMFFFEIFHFKTKLTTKGNISTIRKLKILNVPVKRKATVNMNNKKNDMGKKSK